MRKFIVKLLYVSIPIICVVGYYAYKYPTMTGDLGRLGNITFDKTYSEKFTKYPCASSYTIDVTSFDDITDTMPILVIGDSFSQRGEYVHFMSSELQQKVQILKSKKIINRNSPEEVFLFLLKKKKDLPPIILIESVERYCIYRLSSLSFSNMRHIEINDNSEQSMRSSFFTKMGEYYKNLLGMENIQSPVLHEHLQTPLFSCKDSECDLFFYSDDTICYFNEDIINAYKKLDTLYTLATNRGITLYYMVAADKYDAYEEKIKNHHYPQKHDFIKPKDYAWRENFYFSKDTLDVLINKGVKDVYYCNDTHWSPIGAKAVGEAIARRIKSKISK